MAKFLHDDVLDALLNAIKNNATRISVCESQPTTYAEATTNKGSGGYKLAIKTITSSDFTGPVAGDTSGRKLTSNQHNSITVDVSGTAAYVALCDATNSKLLLVTTCSSVAITAGNSITINSFDIEVGSPT